MTEVIMPKMGDAMEEGVLIEWLKAEGDSVREGEAIGTIQTDKATVELEAPGSGTLSGILVQPGETVPVGRPIAALLAPGESLPPDWSAGRAAGESGAPSAQPARSPAREAEPSSATVPPPPPMEAAVGISTQSPTRAATGAGGRIKASPLARKIALSEGLDLGALRGSGPGGRIVERDVLAALASVPESGKRSRPAAITEDQVVPLNPIRKIAAQRTAESKQQAPHFYITVEVNLDRLLDFREQYEAATGIKPSINDCIIRASALALRDMPEANAEFRGDSILLRAQVNIGVATATDQGLTVPVLRNADRLDLSAIAQESKRLVKKARDNRLSPEELSGSTFGISNMGMLNVDQFAAILNPPNSVILAVATARKQVVPNDAGELEVRTRVAITGSFDHRVLDGASGAKFMNLVRDYLENPLRLLL